MISPNDEQPRFSKNARHEMMPCCDFRSKLGRRIDGRIDVPAEPFLCRGERMHHVLEWRVANHQEIDVARRAEFAACRGPEHERDLNAIAKRCESPSEEVDEPGRLRKQPAQLREDRCVAVGLKIHLPSLHSAPHQARRREQFQLALDSADRGSGLAHDLA
jgi:hypothetical protein